MQGSGKVLDLATPLHPERSGDTDPPPHTHTQAHKAARRPASERTRRAEPTGPAEARARLPRPSPPRLSPALPSASSPAARPQGSAGRGGGGARAAPAQKAESRGSGARSVSAAPTAPGRKPAGAQPPRSPASSPGPARPRAMELLWAPLLGLCCSLAAADRHTVFWNSSNPK